MPALSSVAMALVLLLGVVELCLLATFGWGNLPLPLPGLLLPGAAFLCYGVAALITTRHSRLSQPRFAFLVTVWGVALAMRAALLPLAPELSDDVYRYLWDGHLLLEGINPYGIEPSDESLAELRPEWHSRINHPEVPTVYPPIMQLLFGLGVVLGSSVLVVKLLWLAFDLGCGLLLYRVAIATRRNPAPVLILYLWSPLLVVETAWSAHFDVVGLFFLTALLWLVSRWPPAPRRRKAALLGATLATGAVVKFLPVVALPSLLRRHGLTAAFAFAITFLALWIPFVSVGLGPLTEGLRTYAEHWAANQGAFAVISALTGSGHLIAARIVAGVIAFGVIAFAAWRRFSLERAFLWGIAAVVLLSPVVHPWYTLWLLPVAALRCNVAFLLLSGLAFLGYWGLATFKATGIWPEPIWLRFAIWLPVWGIVLFYGTQAVRRRAQFRT